MVYRHGIVVGVMLLLLVPASGGINSELAGLLYSYDDPLMTSVDLAFLLVTHGYNAIPKDGYVIVFTDNTTYMLIPNGDRAGLADVSELYSSSLAFK